MGAREASALLRRAAWPLATALLLLASGLAAPMAQPAPPPGLAVAQQVLAIAEAPTLAEAVARAFALRGDALPTPSPATPGLGEAVALAQWAMTYDPALMPAAVRDVARAVDALLAELPAGVSGAPCAVLDQRPLLCVAGDGADVHGDEAFVTVDTGGDDTWLGSAGGAGPGEVRVAIDLGGDDTYAATLASDGAAQGAGLGGVGILWDLGGLDTYTCLGTGATRMACQGAASLEGFGLLLDGGGDDIYFARLPAPIFPDTPGVFRTPNITLAAQGGAANRDPMMASNGVHQGFGVLADAGGDDTYEAAARSGYDIAAPWVQGLMGETTMGAQGAGVGGMGVLADGGGHDRYSASALGNKTACALQGAALFAAQGLLADAAGDDAYAVQCGQWLAADPPAGVAITTFTGFVNAAAQGAVQYGLLLRGVRSTPMDALLADLGGHDRYLANAGQVIIANSTVRAEARTQIDWFTLQGAALEGEAVLLDLAGDDRYALSVQSLALANSPQGRAAARANDIFVYGQAAAGYGAALLLDLGGSDTYAATAVLDARITGQPLTPPPSGTFVGLLNMGVQGAGDQRVTSPDQQGLGLFVDLDLGAPDTLTSSPYDPTCQPPVFPKEHALLDEDVEALLDSLPRAPLGGPRGSPLWFDCDPGGVGVLG